MPSPRQHNETRVLPVFVPGIEALRIGSQQSFGKHWHNSFGFGVMEKGGHRSASGRGQVEVLEGSVLTHNPGEVHDGIPIRGNFRRWSMVLLQVPVMLSLSGQADTLGTKELEFTSPVFDDPQVVQQLKRLLEVWEARGTREVDIGLARLGDESALSVLCTRILKRHGTARPPTRTPACMRAVRDRLADEAAAPPSLGSLAAPLGISRYQLLRRFTEVFGLTPYAWLRAYRLEKARKQVSEGAPLSAVAVECGFSDQSHMTRAFRSSLGYSPGARKAVLQPRSRRTG